MRHVIIAAVCAALTGFLPPGFSDDRPVCAPGAHRSRETGEDKVLSAEEIDARMKAAKVTFDWNDAKLSDVVKDLAKATDVKITVDPKIQAQQITLRVSKMDASLALDWVMKLCSATAKVKDGAIVIE